MTVLFRRWNAVPFVVNGRKSFAACSSDVNPTLIEWSLKQPLVSLCRSVQIASVVLEGSHLDPMAQPLDLQILEMVVLVILDDDLLQFTNLSLHS